MVDRDPPGKQPDRAAQEPEREFVLGREIAQAHAAEQRRIAEGTADQSPMPKEVYDSYRGDNDLLRIKPHELDDKLRAVVRLYMSSPPVAQARMRGAISLEEFYTLISFCHRMAVWSLRRQDASCVIDGIGALAMIELERVDFRDLHWIAGILHTIGFQVGIDPREIFEQAARTAEPETADTLRIFATRPREPSGLKASLYEQVETEEGIGLVQRDTASYKPTVNLFRAALDISDLIGADKYQPSITIATEIFPVWFDGGDQNVRVVRALTSNVAAISISGELRPEHHPDPRAQMLLIYCVETATESDAATLERASQGEHSPDTARLGIARGSLYSLMIARSVMGGTASFETQKNLSRFSSPIAQILTKQSHAPVAGGRSIYQVVRRKFFGRNES